MEKKRVCVTGAGGFAASWLVKLLLSKGFIVHGTFRDPVTDEKYAHLKLLENASENLVPFKADILDFVSVVSAVAGCEGVFHVASPVPTSKVLNPEVEVLEPAVTGTKNVLKASLDAKVKRVVMVSSTAAISMKPDWDGEVFDESCWSDELYCRTIQSWYYLSKTIAEREALDFASKTSLDVVTVCPTLVIGPMLQSTINASSLVLINLLKGTRETVENTPRNVVDVRDLAEALLLVYEKPEALGRHIANSHAINTRDLIELFKPLFPNYNYPKNIVEVEKGKVYSSEKLQLLGWKFRPLEETLKDAVNQYQSAHLLE